MPGTTATVTEESPPSPEETPPNVELTDLGSLDGTHNNGVISAINNKGQAVGWAYKTDSEGYPAIFSSAGRRSIAAAFSGWVHVRPLGINDAGVVVGDVSNGADPSMFRWVDGAMTNLGPGTATDINDDGMILTQWGTVLRPDQPALDLSPEMDAEPSALNNYGAVVGVVDVDADPNTRDWRAFRSRPDERLDVSQDLLPSPGRALATDVNGQGVTVGYGRDESGGYVPLFWGADGAVSQASTPLGGKVAAVNNAGLGVGVMYDADGKERAAMYEGPGSAGALLQDLLPPDSPWVLEDARDINDSGQVAGHMHHVDAPFTRHGYILDLHAGNKPQVVGFAAEHRDYPSEDWIELPGRGTYDGNRVKLRAQVKNGSPFSTMVTVEFRDASGALVEGGRFEEWLEGGQTADVEVVVDTAGASWADARGPNVDPRRYRVEVSMGGAIQDGADVSFMVRPRPVVLVHGYKSNAQDSWGKYAPILAEGHPYLQGYAVGDGQFDGRMNTGSLSAPFDRTNTLAENAVEEGVYIHDLRSKLDAWHVDIVAHSMGGLVSRYYIQELMPEPPEDGRPVVNRLIQLGTPNMGSTCAYIPLSLPKPALFPASLHLSPDYVDGIFNKEVTRLNGVRISNLVGRLGPILCGKREFGDWVVPDYSALWTLEDTQDTFSIHTAMTEDVEDFKEYVLPRLKQPPVTVAEAPVPNRTRAAATSEAADATAQRAPTVFVTEQVSVEPGTTKSVDLPVTAAEAFGVTTMGGPSLHLTLRDANGQVRGTLEPGSSSARQPFQGLKVENPAPGTWRLWLRNDGTESVTVPLSGWLIGSALTMSVDAAAQDNGRVSVVAVVRDEGAPTEAVVTAVVTDADGVQHDVDLADDGRNGDGAAGDGSYGAITDALPDGDTLVVARASTPAGLRVAPTAVRVATVDRTPKALTLTSQPGGSAVATPEGPTYEFGSKVVLKATPKPGELHQGWIIDGVEKPAGDLTLTMDGDHEVVAQFGHYTLTELPALPGGRQEETQGRDLNDHGQVALEVVERYPGGPILGIRRAGVYADGELTLLPGLPCEEEPCSQTAFGINNSGDVVGTSSANEDRVYDRATVWRRGVPTDLHPDDVAAESWAVDIADNGQIVGGYYYLTDRHVYVDGIWTNRVFRRYTDPRWRGGVINTRGRVALDWVTYGPLGHVTRQQAAQYSGGTAVKLPQLQLCPSPENELSSRVDGINASGVMVGYAYCHHYGPTKAMVWKGGTASSIGDGYASDINDGDLVVGARWDGQNWHQVLWTNGQRSDLKDYIPGACPVRIEETRTPCYNIQRLGEVNNKGQILASGAFRDHGDLPGTWSDHPRSFLLSPSKVDADLAVTQEAPLAEVAPGVSVTRTVTVTNNGPDEATGVVVDLEVPQQMAVTGCTGSAGGCAVLKSGRRSVIDRLASGESATLTLKARVSETAALGSKLVTTATVFSRAVRDKAMADNSTARTATVRPMIEDGIMWPDAVGVGTESYPVTRKFTNRTEGPMTVGDVTVTDGFRVTDDCPTTLASGQTCTVTVVFTPTEARGYSGAVSLPANPGGLFTIPVHGTGKANNAKPVITPTAPQTGVVGEFTLRVAFTDADVNDTHTAQIVWPNTSQPVPVDTIEESGGSGVVIARRTFHAPVTGARAIVILSDSGGNSTLAPVEFSITDKPANTAPVVMVGGDEGLLTGDTLTRLGAFSDTGSSSWTATVDYGDGSGVQPLTLDGHDFELRHTYTEPGTHLVKVRVVDDGGLSGTAIFAVTVTKRNTDPEVTLEPAPNAVEGEGWTLRGSFTDPDLDAWSAIVDYGDGVVESFPVDGKNVTLDHAWADDGVHTVTVTISDGVGGEDSAEVDVSVANAAPTATLVAPSPGTTVAVGTPVSLHASLADVGPADTHTATWHVGEVDLEGTVTEAGGVGTILSERTFSSSGRYRIALTVTDDDGAKVVVNELNGEPLVLTVIDPESRIDGRGAFVGAAGACTLDASCGSSGNTAFSIRASYDQGNLTPTGEVRVTTSGFKLASSQVTDLITADGNGSLKGTGMVNGDVPVRFAISMVGNRGPGHPGQLRLRVWRTSDARLVYDNAPGGVDSGAGEVNGHLDVR